MFLEELITYWREAGLEKIVRIFWYFIIFELIRYVLVDYQKYYYPYPDWLREIKTGLIPVKAWKNDIVTELYALDENHTPAEKAVLLEEDPTVRYIKLYDLGEIYPEIKTGQTQ